MSRRFAFTTGTILLCSSSVPSYGQSVQNTQWNVPYYDQLAYLNWGQSACGPTSITMLLKYWFPNSTVDIPEVYHGATQENAYNGPLYWYRNVGWALNTGDYWPGTHPDTGYDRTEIPIPGGPKGFQQYYNGKYSGLVTVNATNYLSNTWGGTIEQFTNQPLVQLLLALQNGPVIAFLNEGYGDHIVVVTGYHRDAVGNEWVVFNEPYYPYSSDSANKSPNYPSDVKDRTVSRSTFNTWYTNRGEFLYLTFGLPASYSSTVRQNSYIIDNGSYFLDEVLATNNPIVPSDRFQVDNVQGQTSSGQYVWWLYHQGGSDFAYPIESGHSVRWTPPIAVGGYYLVKVRSQRLTNGSSVYYSVDSPNASLGGATVDQAGAGPFEATLGEFYLTPGSYVEVADMPANTAADTVVFEYIDPVCVAPVTSSLNAVAEIAAAVSENEKVEARTRYDRETALASAINSPVLSAPPTLTASCSANPAIIGAGQSAVFTGSSFGGTGVVSGVWGGAVSGNGLTANYNSALQTPAGSYKAAFTANDSGSPKQTATASCSVQVNPAIPTISKSGLVGSALANLPFDLIVTGTNIVISQIQAWVFDTEACSAGCRQPDALVTNVSNTGLTLHNLQLAAGDHYVKLRNTDSGAWSNASGTFSVVGVTNNTFSEYFSTPPNYSNNWVYSVGSGNPTVTYTSGDLNVRAPVSGSSALFRSIQAFTGNIDATFTFDHHNFGRTTVGLYSPATQQWFAEVDLDTDDTAYLNFSSGSQSSQYTFPSAPYMNTTVAIRIVITGSQAQFYADGILKETYAFTGSSPYQLAFATGSVPWKSGDNITDFYSVVANGTISASIPTGTVSVTVSGYAGNVACTLNGVSITAPTTFGGEPTGSYQLACTPPSGYTIASIAPAVTQNVVAGGTTGFGVNLATIPALPTTGGVTVLATLNGQSYSGAMACGFLNSPSNIGVNAVPFSQNNLPLGTYNLNCAGGPPNSQLQSFSPSSNQTLAAGKTITFTAVYGWATVTVYSNPLPIPTGSWTWNLTAWSSSGSGTWISQPVLTVAGKNYTYSHPEQYVLALQQMQTWGATGSLALFISQFQAVLSYWPPYTVVSSGSSAPTLSSYYWNNTPQNDLLFSGNFSGTGFVSGNSAVYFCVDNTTTCYLQPASGGVAVNSAISLSVYNVKLTTGYWQAKVVTPNGTAVGPPFYVQ